MMRIRPLATGPCPAAGRQSQAPPPYQLISCSSSDLFGEVFAHADPRQKPFGKTLARWCGGLDQSPPGQHYPGSNRCSAALRQAVQLGDENRASCSTTHPPLHPFKSFKTFNRCASFKLFNSEAESGKNFFGSLLDSGQRKQPGSSILRPVPVVPIVQPLTKTEGRSNRSIRSMVRQAHHDRLDLPLVLSSSKDALRSSWDRSVQNVQAVQPLRYVQTV